MLFRSDAATDDVLAQKRSIVRSLGSISSADAAKLSSTLQSLAPAEVADVLDKMGQVQDLVNTIQSFLSPRPFVNLHSMETEARYRAREIHKNIEHFFKKKVVEILMEIIGVLGLPNPLDIPLPFAPSATVKDMFRSEEHTSELQSH